jgi:dipeptidyl aminopeptidase/acylaminoacyl peptidase
VTPDALHLIRTPSAPTLHPDADRCVVSVVRPDDEQDAYVGQLWEVWLEGGTRRLTRGFRDTAPVYSPDGRLLAFLRAEKKGKPQLHVVDALGGEPVCLTDNPLGAGAPVWSPSGEQIAYVARVPEEGRYGTDEEVGSDAEPPRLIKDLRYLEDALGYGQDRRSHVFTVDVHDLASDPLGWEPSSGTQVTQGDADHWSVAWSPDGSRLAFASARHDGRLHDLRSDVFTCAVDGSDVVQMTDTSLAVGQVAWALDGRSLFVVASDYGVDGTDFIGRSSGLFTVEGDRLTRLTGPELDLGEDGWAMTVTPDGVLVNARDRGAVRLLRISGDAVDVLVDGPVWVSGHDAKGDAVVAVVADPSTYGDVVLVGGEALTDFSADLGARPLQELTVTADDGYPVHGWAVLPDGPGPHPVLLDIHGGPFTQFGWKPYDEAQVLAAAGYAVLLANPRGSAGYGEEHGRCIAGAMGQRDAADLVQFLDGALEQLPLDDSRVGVMGGSYGGYMTAWLLATQPSRFAAGIVERGFLDPFSFIGTSDIGWFFPEAYLGENMTAQSPFAIVDQVTAPTLVIHSEQDLRCPLEQGQRYFAELVRNGVDAEFLVFPGESHGLTRGGRPRHRRQRFEHVLRWWATHLPVS